ncbi:mitochondrial inner membrane protease ATP23-like [Solanum verrucosum]|uniref:mitochondrial inner membrane protease ATP23-like n=1 Tax=Solanum verrucosum TaxID=315347 RepID=UPI0020D1D7B2|nr:mitochondrial inner membrane protease ATP23-like [Solanum verrucosum]
MAKSSTINKGSTVEECQEMIRRGLRTPMVKFLKEHLEKSGCRIGDNFIKASHCDQKISGGYARGRGIIVCSNHMQIQDEVNQVLIHELIHAYDECRAANLDWANCAHHACSEIRAGHLSGDCHYKRELLRGYLKIRAMNNYGAVSVSSLETPLPPTELFSVLKRICSSFELVSFTLWNKLDKK